MSAYLLQTRKQTKGSSKISWILSSSDKVEIVIGILKYTLSWSLLDSSGQHVVTAVRIPKCLRESLQKWLMCWRRTELMTAHTNKSVPFIARTREYGYHASKYTLLVTPRSCLHFVFSYWSFKVSQHRS